MAEENMTPKDKVEKLLASATKLSTNQVAAALEVPPDSKLGDLAFPCFMLAKTLKKAPNQIASQIASHMKSKEFDIKSIGPYVNFFFKKGAFVSQTVKQILKVKQKFGSRSKQNKTYVLDVFQPNTHKSLHVGHLRNAAIGESIRSVLVFSGINAKAVSYIGDTGAHIAKWLWYFKNFYKKSMPKDATKIGELYPKAHEKMSQKASYSDAVQKTLVDLEAGNKELNSLWEKSRKICLDYYISVANELGLHIDTYMYESEVEKPGKKIVQDMLQKGLAEVSEGAPVIDLEKYDLKVMLLQKKTGASLYSTKDLGLNVLKRKKYAFDKSIYVTGSEQDFYFQQLIKTMEIIWPNTKGDYIHIGYGLVQSSTGKFSSRFGTAPSYESLRSAAINAALKEVVKRNPKMSKAKQEKLAKSIALSALKYNMLRTQNNWPIIFNMKEALSLEGNTSLYLQYALVRANKILKKAGKTASAPSEKCSTKQEFELAKLLASYPDVVLEAAEQYAPHKIANYAYKLSKQFSSFYEACPVLTSSEREGRLALVKAFSIVLASSLKLLGISEVEMM